MQIKSNPKFVLLAIVSSSYLVACKPTGNDSELNWYKKGAKKAAGPGEGNEWVGTEDDKPYAGQKSVSVTPAPEKEEPVTFGGEKVHWTLAGFFAKDGKLAKLKQHVVIDKTSFKFSTKKNPQSYEMAEKSLEAWWNGKMSNWAAKKKFAKEGKDTQQQIDELNKMKAETEPNGKPAHPKAKFSFKASWKKVGGSWAKMKAGFKKHFWDKEKARVESNLEAKSENGMKAMLSMWYDVYLLEHGLSKSANHTVEMNGDVGISAAESGGQQAGAAFQVLIAGQEVFGKSVAAALDIAQFIPVPKFLNQSIPIVGYPELVDIAAAIEVYPEIKMVGDLDIRQGGGATISIGPKTAMVLGFGVNGRLIAGTFQAGAKAAIVPIEGTFPVSVTAGLSKTKKFFYGGVTFAGATIKMLTGRLVLVAKIDPPWPFNLLMYPAAFLVNNVGTYLTKKDINLNPANTEWELPIWAPDTAYKVINPAGKWTGPVYLKVLAGADCKDAHAKMDAHIKAMTAEAAKEKDVEGKAVDKGIQMQLTKVKTMMNTKCPATGKPAAGGKTPTTKTPAKTPTKK